MHPFIAHCVVVIFFFFIPFGLFCLFVFCLLQNADFPEASKLCNKILSTICFMTESERMWSTLDVMLKTKKIIAFHWVLLVWHQMRTRPLPLLTDWYLVVFLQVLRLIKLIDELGGGAYESGWWCQAKCEPRAGGAGIHGNPESGNHHQALSHWETQWRYLPTSILT